MSISDKLKAADKKTSLFDEIPSDRRYAIKQRAKIAASIFRARKTRQLSQSEFADLCGVSQAMVSKWESGDCNFTIDGWSELSHKLNLPFDPQKTPPAKGTEDYTMYGNIVSLAHYRATASSAEQWKMM